MPWLELDESPSISYNILHNDLWSESEGEPLPKKKANGEDGPYIYHGKQDVDGWEVHEMESGEYPDHDAIFIDRNNNRVIINYQGHHSPMFEQFGEFMNDAGYSQVAGHFRSAPSTTEPYPAGWGWHTGPANAEEKKVLKKVLKNHYQIQQLKDLYTPDESGEAEENHFDLEGDTEHEAHVLAGKLMVKVGAIWQDFAPPKVSARNVEWLDNDRGNLTWKGLYDILGDRVILWSTDDTGYPHHFERMGYGPYAENPLYKNIGLEGYYTKPQIPQGDPEYVERALSLLVPALQERWPTKQTNLKTAAIRWMLKDDGQVLLGSYKTHYELLSKLHGEESANVYDTGGREHSEKYPFITGGFVNDSGQIMIVRSSGEPPFDPVNVAQKVYNEAKQYEDLVSGEVIYRDDVEGTIKEFELSTE